VTILKQCVAYSELCFYINNSNESQKGIGKKSSWRLKVQNKFHEHDTISSILRPIYLNSLNSFHSSLNDFFAQLFLLFTQGIHVIFIKVFIKGIIIHMCS
jgi:hypothetical protein